MPPCPLHVLFFLRRELAFASVHRPGQGPSALPLRRWLLQLGTDRFCLAPNSAKKRCFLPINHRGDHFNFRYSPDIPDDDLRRLLAQEDLPNYGANWWPTTTAVCGIFAADDKADHCTFNAGHGGYHSWEHSLGGPLAEIAQAVPPDPEGINEFYRAPAACRGAHRPS